MLASATALALALQSPPPMVEFDQLLNTKFFLQNEMPEVMLEPVQVIFAPSDDFKVTMKVKAGDDVIAEPEFLKPDMHGTFAQVRNYTGTIKLGTTNGPRSIEVYVDDKLAGKYDFTLTKKSGGDPLAPKVAWVLDGPWKDHAYFHHTMDTGNRPDIYAVYWVGDREYDRSVSSPKIHAEIRKGNTVLATGKDRVPSGLGYSRFDHQFYVGNNVLTMNDIKSWNGEHAMHVVQDGKSIKSYKFSMKNGAIVPHPRSSIEQPNPERFLTPRRLPARGTAHVQCYWMAPN